MLCSPQPCENKKKTSPNVASDACIFAFKLVGLIRIIIFGNEFCFLKRLSRKSLKYWTSQKL